MEPNKVSIFLNLSGFGQWEGAADASGLCSEAAGERRTPNYAGRQREGAADVSGLFGEVAGWRGRSLRVGGSGKARRMLQG